MTTCAKTLDLASLTTTVCRHQQHGYRVVMTSGCFDLLHVGHVRFLAAARRLGTLLVVLVNADDSVRQLKGEGRPIVPLQDRMELLAALASVDYVGSFEDISPDPWIELLQPQVWVKGGDYDPETLPERTTVEKYGGHVCILPNFSQCRTTALVDRLRANSGDREIVA